MKSKLNKKKKIIGIIIFSIIFIIGAILFAVKLDLLAIFVGQSNWVDQESYASWDGPWKSDYPVTNAYDENWNTPTVIHDTYKEANIYEYSILDYPSDAVVDYLEFYVMYGVGIIPEVQDHYAYIEYYVWNYQTSSWDKIYEDSSDSGGRAMRQTIQVSALNHIQNKEVRLRTHAVVGFLQAVWVYETQARASYSREVDCNINEVKCGGAEDKEYFTCSKNNIWENQGVTIGKCEVVCISNSDCSQDFKCSSNNCIPDRKSCYRFTDNQCNLISLLPSEKTSNDYDTFEGCQNNIIPTINVYKVVNNSCLVYKIYENEKVVGDFNSLSECQESLTGTGEENPIGEEDEKKIDLKWVFIPLIVVTLIIIFVVLFFKRKSR